MYHKHTWYIGRWAFEIPLMKKSISPDIKLKLIELSGKCFWFWSTYYNFYSAILETSSGRLEKRFPRDQYNKFKATEILLDELSESGKEKSIKEIISAFYKMGAPHDKGENPNYEDAKLLLRDFKQTVGKDVVEEELKNQKFQEGLKESKKKGDIEKEKETQSEIIRGETGQWMRRGESGKERIEEAIF